MSLTFHSLRRPVSVALVVLASLAPLAPSRVQGQEATPAAEAVAVSQPADTVPPVLEQPGPLSAEAVDARGASVLYNGPFAADAVDGPVPVGCDFPSGTLFPIGTTWVTCGAQDVTGNAAAVQFSVTVSDTVPPVLEQPGNLLVEAVDASGAAVSYPLPAASDAVSGSVLVSCDIPSGAVFPITTALVTCGAQDAAGNAAAVQFSVTVSDTVPPVLEQPGNLLVEAVDASGAAVSYPLPAASDAVSGSVLVSCDIPSGAVFPITTALVTCGAQDAAGNAAAVQFSVTVNPPPPPTPALESESPAGPTDPPAPTRNTQPPAPTANTQPPALATTPSTGSARDAVVATTPVATSTARVTVTATPAVKEAAVIEVEQAGVLVEEAPSVAPALPLPWPPPGNFVLVTDGGPLGRLALIWANREFPISQEFGHTAFSVSQPFMYRYGIAYGLDGFEHTGLDIGMPAGTWLYSPVEGTVKTSGGTPYFTHYGNGEVGVGELLIETDTGDEVMLGHMGAIAVRVGERVKVGQFVGLSGGFNGDHLHLETRELQAGGGYRIVDPRRSFLVEALASFESLRDELVIDGRLLDDSIIDPTSSYLADGAGAASIRLDERQLGDSLLDSRLTENSVVDLGAGLVMETHPDPFLPDDPLLGGSLLPDFVVDPRQTLLLDTFATASSLPDDRSLDVGSFDDGLLQDSIVDPGSAFLLEPRPVSLPVEGGFIREI